MNSPSALRTQSSVGRPPAPPGGPLRRLPGTAVSTPARVLGAVVSGGLLYLAFPPFDLPWTAVPAVALLTLVCRGAGARTGALLGLLHGLALFLPLVEWAGEHAGVGALVALALLQAAFFALLGAA